MVRRTLPVLLVLGGLAVLWFTLAPVTPASVDLALVNGVIYTVDRQNSIVEAIAMHQGRIVATGSTAVILESTSPSQVIDLRGRAVYPGFIDAHAHLESLGAQLVTLDLAGTRSVAEIQDRVRERLAGLSAGAWLRGRGWDQNRWVEREFPTRAMLDEVSPETPVVLTRIDGHALWANTAALRKAGIGDTTPDPEGGRIMRDSRGLPTGVLIDNAMNLIAEVIPAPSVHERTEAIRKAVAMCLKLGITGVHDMGVDREGLDIYQDLIRSGDFPFRVYAAIDGPGPTLDAFWQSGPDTGGHDGRLTVRAIKLYADGALGSRGAALVEPYDDDSTNRGLTLLSQGQIAAIARMALDRGFQVCTHAIGDRANHVVLNAYEEALGGRAMDHRFRVEHAQVVQPSDIPRFARSGIIPSMQPTHCTSDMPWAESRVGPRRIKGAYAWRSFIDLGCRVPGGSDFPVEHPNPLAGIYAAVTRQDAEGHPEGGWYPEQRMTREEALRAFTIWAAEAAFHENALGSLEPGKRADCVVLSDDIMTVELRRILSTTVLTTIVNGKVVYSAESP